MSFKNGAIFDKIALLTSPSENPFNFGPKIFPVHIIVNIQKGGTIFIMYLLMLYFNNYSTFAGLRDKNDRDNIKLIPILGNTKNFYDYIKIINKYCRWI